MVVAAGKRPRERHEPAHERLARTRIARAPRAEQYSVAIPPSTRILLRSGLYSRHPRPPWSFALLRRYYGRAPVSNGAPQRPKATAGPSVKRPSRRIRRAGRETPSKARLAA